MLYPKPVWVKVKDDDASDADQIRPERIIK
jgi:hypothetical protein